MKNPADHPGLRLLLLAANERLTKKDAGNFADKLNDLENLIHDLADTAANYETGDATRAELQDEVLAFLSDLRAEWGWDLSS